jgi:hypothetical protein
LGEGVFIDVTIVKGWVYDDGGVERGRDEAETRVVHYYEIRRLVQGGSVYASAYFKIYKTRIGAATFYTNN